MPLRITAGSTDAIGNQEIEKDPNEWLIVDIGFSRISDSCGVWTNREGARVVSFGGLVSLLGREFQEEDPQILNLVIEAPLSIAFQGNGNPTIRKCDRLPGKSQPRPYYTNAGATTFIAALMLFREMRLTQVLRPVRLFEGFLSFKSSSGTSDHVEDVRKIKDAIWTGRNCDIFEPTDLLQERDHRIESAAFPFLDINLIPPVIRIKPDA